MMIHLKIWSLPTNGFLYEPINWIYDSMLKTSSYLLTMLHYIGYYGEFLLKENQTCEIKLPSNLLSKYH
jgi:hypothetical protein